LRLSILLDLLLHHLHHLCPHIIVRIKIPFNILITGLPRPLRSPDILL
jgi:hypothetical protein